MKRVMVIVVAAVLVMAAACGPSGVSQEEHDRIASELSSAKQQAASLQSELSSAEQKVAGLQSELSSAQQEVANLQSELDQRPQEEYDRLSSELSSAKQRVTELEAQLAAVPSELEQLRQEHDQAAEVRAMLLDFATAWEALDAEKAASFYTEDCSLLEPDYAADGREGIRELIQWLHDNTQKIEIKSVMGDPDWGCAEGLWTTLDRKGGILEIPYCSIYEFQDGKVGQERVYYDTWPQRK
jgi:peptidoglycan hydrolase CwlO-like protein